MKKLLPSLLFILALLSVGALLVAPDLAEQLLPGDLPIGNALMALVFCGISGSALLVSSAGSACRRFSAVALAASALWLPASALLAGNLALNFSGARGTAWLAGSAAVIAAALFALVWAMVGSALGRPQRP